jgi:hypothetical protein
MQDGEKALLYRLEGWGWEGLERLCIATILPELTLQPYRPAMCEGGQLFPITIACTSRCFWRLLELWAREAVAELVRYLKATGTTGDKHLPFLT